ncbi:hypothetical protein LTR35_012649 [Friedmanniomyces endolithicus]|nr:hypothetical protein LTR35_012649 [Friedmanniomyces endolithicus]
MYGRSRSGAPQTTGLQVPDRHSFYKVKNTRGMDWVVTSKPSSPRARDELAQSGVVVAEIVWHGRAVNDIVRPDGEVAVKATGQAFECHVCMLIRVNDDKKICRLDEYYNRKWDDGIAEEKYLLMKGKSIRD